ncbi:MAG: nidogen-like domain-containing protein [Bacteroidota bacterium]
MNKFQGIKPMGLLSYLLFMLVTNIALGQGTSAYSESITSVTAINGKILSIGKTTGSQRALNTRTNRTYIAQISNKSPQLKGMIQWSDLKDRLLFSHFERVGIQSTSNGQVQLLGYKKSYDVKQGVVLITFPPINIDPAMVITPQSGGVRASCSSAYISPDGTYTTLSRSDDGSTSAIPLGFTFSLCGNNYTEVYINNNGNLTFDNAFSTYDPDGFPQTTPMVAPFWADVDTRNTAGGLLYYKIFSNYMIVTWDGVGYYDQKVDKLNYFQVIISDGTASIIGTGNHVQFRYGDMAWTTGDVTPGTDGNGFGGDGATVGQNSGDGVNFEQEGRFANDNSTFDGPFGNADGVHYLDNNCFVYSANTAPVAVCQDITINLNSGNNFSLTLNDNAVDNGSTDDCGIQSYSLSQTTFTCDHLGPNVVTLTVTDANAFTSTCTATVTVNATTTGLPPVAVCQDITVNLNSPSYTATIVATDVDNGSTGDCGIQTYAISQSSFSCSDIGNNSVTLTVTDYFGRVSTCTANVLVQETDAPSILCTSPGSGTCTTTDFLTSPNQFFNGTTFNSTQTVSGIGTSIDDLHLTTDFRSRNCSDIDAYLISPSGTRVEITTDNGGTFNHVFDGTYWDEDSGNDVTTFSYANNVVATPLNPEGNLGDFNGEDPNGTWTLEVTDDNGSNTFGIRLQSWELHICASTPSTGPVCCQDTTVTIDPGQCDAYITIPAIATSDDGCGVTTVVNNYNNTSDASDTYPAGSTLVTWTVTDGSGNTTTCAQTITVNDPQVPTAVCQNHTVQLELVEH